MGYKHRLKCGKVSEDKIFKKKKKTKFSGLLVFVLEAFNLSVKLWATLPCGLHY